MTYGCQLGSMRLPYASIQCTQGSHEPDHRLGKMSLQSTTYKLSAEL
jgi:hypothetical protein